MSNIKKYRSTPPGHSPKLHLKQKVIRFFVHIFVWLGAAVIYYIAFSFFFDTPVEHRMKNSTALLRSEYEALSSRFDTLSKVYDNIAERDKNVFRILFEADPYNIEDDFEANHWHSYEKLLAKSDKELTSELMARTAQADKHMSELMTSYRSLQDKLRVMGADVNRIPSIQPVNNKDLTLLTASFGMRLHPFYKTLKFHPGVDYTVPIGSHVFATADGRVKDISVKRSSSGTTITITHGGGYETQYNHLLKANVVRGQEVKRGDIIALSGNSGLSLTPHLHYEIKYNGLRVDPIHYFFMELSPSDYRKLVNIAKSGMQSFD